MSLSQKDTSYLGIDIGSSGVKIIELKKEQGQIVLANYGFCDNCDIVFSDNVKDINFVGDLIKKIHEESDMDTKDAVSALPAFAVFSSVLNLSNIAAKDIDSAVHWEAKKVIPLPLEEMIIDWKNISTETESTGSKKNTNTKVLLTGAPKDLVGKYIKVFKYIQFNLHSLETESFSLIRSLLPDDKSISMIVEIGASTTDVSIVENRIPMFSRSVDVGGKTITAAISKQLNVDKDKAEQFKRDFGAGAKDNSGEATKVINESIAPVINEIKYATNLYQNKNNKRVEKVVLSGGSALLPNLPAYLSKLTDMKVVIGNPWSQISCPVDLKQLLDEIGPQMSVAIGLALRGLK